MLTPQELRNRIIERCKIRAEIASKGKEPDTFLLISESVDDYLENKIQTDKFIIGILNDIQGNIAGINVAQGDMNVRSEIKDTFDNNSKGAKMLKGIVKPNGEIVSMDDIVGRERDAAIRCFEAGFLCGVNENDAMIICQDGKDVAVTIQEPIPKISQGNNGQLPTDEAPEPPAEKMPEPPGPQPAEPQGPQPAEPTRSPNEPKPGAIKPFTLPEKRPSRKQARLDAQS